MPTTSIKKWFRDFFENKLNVGEKNMRFCPRMLEVLDWYPGYMLERDWESHCKQKQGLPISKNFVDKLAKAFHLGASNTGLQ